MINSHQNTIFIRRERSSTLTSTNTFTFNISFSFCVRTQKSINYFRNINIRRTTSNTETGIRKSRKPKPEYVDAQYTMEALPELLPQADIVALSLPGYSDTKGVIGEKELHLMKENTILLNVGRGTAIDSLALAKALQEGTIYGAGLDVTDPEPLLEDHPLWDAPHCIITPHVSGGYALPETLEKILELSIENLERYEKGETLHNIIDFSTGYVKR